MRRIIIVSCVFLSFNFLIADSYNNAKSVSAPLTNYIPAPRLQQPPGSTDFRTYHSDTSLKNPSKVHDPTESSRISSGGELRNEKYYPNQSGARGSAWMYSRAELWPNELDGTKLSGSYLDELSRIMLDEYANTHYLEESNDENIVVSKKYPSSSQQYVPKSSAYSQNLNNYARNAGGSQIYSTNTLRERRDRRSVNQTLEKYPQEKQKAYVNIEYMLPHSTLRNGTLLHRQPIPIMEAMKIAISSRKKKSLENVRFFILLSSDGHKTYIALNQKGGYTNEFCSPIARQPVISASCGEYYIGIINVFLSLAPNNSECTWRFRNVPPEIKFDIDLKYSPSNLKIGFEHMSVDYRYNNEKSTHRKIWDLVITSTAPLDDEFSMNICLPGPRRRRVTGYEEFDYSETSSRISLPNCGKSPIIVKSRAYPDGKNETYPWQANLYVFGSWNVQCSGTLISSRWVLSVASCFSGVTNDQYLNMYVFFGMNSREGDRHENFYYATDLQLYPGSSTNHDLALVRLDRIPPRPAICLPPYAIPHFDTQSTDISITDLDAASRKTQSIPVSRVLNTADCSLLTKQLMPMHVICSKAERNIGHCMPYSNLVVQKDVFFLYGVSMGCGTDVDLFTSIPFFMTWISNVTKVTIPSSSADGSSEYIPKVRHVEVRDNFYYFNKLYEVNKKSGKYYRN